METILVLVAIVSLIAFVVGMFSPKTVKCKSRGKVALIYMSLFFISAIIGSFFSKPSNISAESPETPDQTSQVESSESVNQEKRTDQEVKSSDQTFQTESSEPTNQEKQTNQEVESSIGKPVQIGYFVYTIQSVSFRKSVGDEFMSETADGIYLLVNLAIKNISDKTRTLDGSLFAVTDKNGTKYEHSTEASTALEISGKKTLFFKECQPNITTKGVLVFEVPEKGEYYLHLIGSFWGVRSARVLLK
jgi:hypothetical protein